MYKIIILFTNNTKFTVHACKLDHYQETLLVFMVLHQLVRKTLGRVPTSEFCPRFAQHQMISGVSRNKNCHFTVDNNTFSLSLQAWSTNKYPTTVFNIFFISHWICISFDLQRAFVAILPYRNYCTSYFVITYEPPDAGPVCNVITSVVFSVYIMFHNTL